MTTIAPPPPGPGSTDSISAKYLTTLPDTTVNGFVVKVAGNDTEYGRGQAFMVLEEGAGDATDQSAAGSILFRIDAKGSIGMNGGMHIAPGLRKPYGGTQAVWIQPAEDTIHLLFSGVAGQTKDFITVVPSGLNKRLSVISDGSIFAWGTDGTTLALGIGGGDTGISGFRSAFNAVAVNCIPMQVNGATGQTADIMRVALNNAIRSRFEKGGRFATRVTTAPADADVATGEMMLWFDSTNGAAKLMVKAKQADGTVRTGSLALA